MERKLSRRNILGAASALAGGSALAGAATAAAPVIGTVIASDGDTLALSLFRQWIAATREYDRQSATDPDSDLPAGDLMTEIEDRILEISGGAVSLALKTHFAVRQDHARWVPEARLLRIPEAFSDDPDWDVQVAVGMLRDAAALVPEILEVAAPVLHEDAPLIDAQIGIRWVRDRLAEPVNLGLAKAWGDDWPEREAQNRRELEVTLAAALDRVAKYRGQDCPRPGGQGGGGVRGMTADNLDPFAFARQGEFEPDGELRAHAEALAAEYRMPLPEGDAGLIEAERRLLEFDPRVKALPETRAGAIVKLRYLLRDGAPLLNGAEEPLEQILALLERETQR